jgi:phosphinothricin acetyltransferase
VNESVRLAAAGDFAAIAAITSHYIRTTAIHFAYADATADELRQAWRDGAATYPWLVLERDGHILGYAKAGAWRARAAYRWSTETGIYLQADECGHGHGERLYRRLLAVLRAQGFHSAIGGIALPNEPSVRLHERLGFEHCGTVRDAGRKFDRWHDVGFWQLLLQPERDAAPLLAPPTAFAASASGPA